MSDKYSTDDELTSVEQVSVLTKWFQLLRLNLIRRGIVYGALWLSDLVVRLTVGASPLRFTKIQHGLHVGGQYLGRGWRLLKQRGISAVINMRIEFDDEKAGIAPDRYLHLPTIDNTAPAIDHLKRGVDFIQQVVEEGGQVYIHCEAGVGRAPTMAAAYLVHQGMAPHAAWELLRRRRPFIRPTLTQIERIEAFAELPFEERAMLAA